ncbi:hypothetical protein AgCh_012213 [Apium graveolens]
MKFARRVEDEDGKVGPTSLTVMGMLRFRERREERDGGGREGRERDFLTEGGREMKESLVAFGSKRDCWERNESKPRIGAAVIVVLSPSRAWANVSCAGVYQGFACGTELVRSGSVRDYSFQELRGVRSLGVGLSRAVRS